MGIGSHGEEPASALGGQLGPGLLWQRLTVSAYSESASFLEGLRGWRPP